MPSDQQQAHTKSIQDTTTQAQSLIQERRWLDAKQLLTRQFQAHPEQVVVRSALAQVYIALGEPDAASALLQPCIDQGVISAALESLYWRAKVRASPSARQAASTVKVALKTSTPPPHLLEEWRMITQGLIIAGWQKEAIAWINALGSSGVPLELKQFWEGASPHPTDPNLDLNAISLQMVLHPSPDLQRKAHQANRNITQAWIQALPDHLAPRPGPRRRWLLCASTDLKQCWLYRLEQKRQQLEALGCSARLLSANELQQEPNPDMLLEQVDGLLIHRLPASQSLFGLIAQARRQGIPVVVDLDDLLFDPEHAPPPLENYAGSIPPE